MIASKVLDKNEIIQKTTKPIAMRVPNFFVKWKEHREFWGRLRIVKDTDARRDWPAAAKGGARVRAALWLERAITGPSRYHFRKLSKVQTKLNKKYSKNEYSQNCLI